MKQPEVVITKPCPDCGGTLNQVSIAGFDSSFRCNRCGGFFTQAWVVNRMQDNAMGQWSPMKFDTNLLTLGTGNCPNGHKGLNKYVGESVPDNVGAFYCGECKWWWWPADSLFGFKEAQEAKKSYAKTWNKMSMLATILLPMLSIVVLVSGVGLGVGLVRQQQRLAVGAGAGIQAFSASYLGSGEELVTFVSPTEVTVVRYKEKVGSGWIDATVTQVNNYSELRLSGLKEGTSYLIEIIGKEYEFVTTN